MIEQMVPWIGEEERWAMDAYLSSGGWLTEHDKTAEFEVAVANYVRAKHCIATTSGTTALVVALDAMGIGRGDEVIVPAFTQTASAGAVELVGATPVFVDINPVTLCIDLELAEAAVTSHTKGLMVVDFNGRSPDMQEVMRVVYRQQVACKHELLLIEDAAQALGSKYGGRCLGTWGFAGCFSFSSPKVITTGQGGAIVTDSDWLMDRARKAKNFGPSAREFGVNFKFTDLQAVIGIEQMKKLSWRLWRKKEMFSLHRNLLAGVEQVKFLPTDLKYTVPWFIDVLVPDPQALQVYLAEQEIGSRLFYKPLCTGFPNADYAAAHGLWLPSSSFLDDKQIKCVCDAIRAYYTP